MAKAKKTWKLVLTSIILSIIILAAFIAVFISFIVPSYDITQEQIYNVLTKALPILIGLVFIEIALISARRGEDDYKDNIDKLSPNSYDSPLYSRPMDDPAHSNPVDPGEFDRAPYAHAVKEIIKEVPVEVVKEVVKEVPKEIIREVPVPVEKIVEKPVEVVRETVKEVPIEVIKEVQVPVFKEIPVDRIVEKPIEVIKEVPVEVVKEVQVPVIKEVEVEKIVEVEKEVPAPIDADIIIRHDYKPLPVKVPVDRIVEREVPVDVIKETVIETPTDKDAESIVVKEIIKEVPVEKVVEVPVEKIVEKEVPGEKTVIIEDEEAISTREAIEEEIAASRSEGYPLIIASFGKDKESEIPRVFEVPALTLGSLVYAILPYTRAKDVQKSIKDMEGKMVVVTARHNADSVIKELSN